MVAAPRDEGRRAGLGRDVCFRRCVATTQIRPVKQAQPLWTRAPTNCSVLLAAEASGRPQAPTPHGRPAYTPSPTSVASTSDTDATSLLYSNVPTIVQPVVERVGLKTDDGEDSECAAACRAPAQCQRRLTAVLCPVPAKSATGRRRTSSRPR